MLLGKYAASHLYVCFLAAPAILNIMKSIIVNC